MKPSRATTAIALLTLLLYASAILLGLRVHDWPTLFHRWASTFDAPSTAYLRKPAWQPPSPHTIPLSATGDLIRRGALLFNETPAYDPTHARAHLSCASCHAEGGIQPFASPVVGMPALFPQFNQRANRIISLQDRVQECYVRSENGQPLDPTGPEMKSILSYISWLSTPNPAAQPFRGRGLITLPDLTPNPTRGQLLYQQQCAGCHGDHGQGHPYVFPPLWGDDSFNDGAGMHGIKKMAAFVQHNMPQNRAGILTPQQAYDVAAYIHTQPRPTFNPAYKTY